MAFNARRLWNYLTAGRTDQGSTVWWTGLTFLGGALNLGLLLFLASVLPTVTVQQQSTQSQLQILNIGLLGIIDGLFLLGYSYASSHILPRKRFVSPLEISILTIAALFLLHSTSDVFIQVIAIAFLGWVTEVLAKYSVGLGGNQTHKRTWRIDSPFRDVAHVLDDFNLILNPLYIDKRVREHDRRLVIYRSNDETSYRFFLALTTGKDEKITWLHLEGYSRGRYAIGRTQTSRRKFIRDVIYIRHVLRGKSFKLQKVPFDNSFPYREEIEHFVMEPTQAKLTSLAHLPKSTVAVFIGIPFLLLAAYLTYSPGATGQYPQQTSLLSAVFGLLMTVVGLFPFIQGPVRDKGWTDVQPIR